MELKRGPKPKGQGKLGRKRPRANYEVIPANPHKVNEKQREYERVDEAQKDDSVLSKTLKLGEDEDIAGNERSDGPVWLKISGIELQLEEKEILQHWIDWLNDKIMDAAQILMRHQFPYISGFDTVFSNSLIIHLVKTKEIRTVTEFGNLILINIDFCDFISLFSP